MKNRTKTLIFFTAMAVTAGTLFATTGKKYRHCFSGNQGKKEQQAKTETLKNESKANITGINPLYLKK